MFKKYFFLFLLLSSSANIIYPSIILEHAFQAGKRGAIWGTIASTACFIIPDSSLMEKIAVPFVAGACSGITSFITQPIKELSISKIQALFSILSNKTSKTFLKPYTNRINKLLEDPRNVYSNNQVNFAQEWGRGVGLCAGLLIYGHCYTQSGFFNRN